jgi:hypothetical protein
LLISNRFFESALTALFFEEEEQEKILHHQLSRAENPVKSRFIFQNREKKAQIPGFFS